MPTVAPFCPEALGRPLEPGRFLDLAAKHLQDARAAEVHDQVLEERGPELVIEDQALPGGLDPGLGSQPGAARDDGATEGEILHRGRATRPHHHAGGTARHHAANEAADQADADQRGELDARGAELLPLDDACALAEELVEVLLLRELRESLPGRLDGLAQVGVLVDLRAVVRHVGVALRLVPLEADVGDLVADPLGRIMEAAKLARESGGEPRRESGTGLVGGALELAQREVHHRELRVERGLLDAELELVDVLGTDVATAHQLRLHRRALLAQAQRRGAELPAIVVVIVDARSHHVDRHVHVA